MLAAETGALTAPGALTATRDPDDAGLVPVLVPPADPFPELVLATDTGALTDPGSTMVITDPPPAEPEPPVEPEPAEPVVPVLVWVRGAGPVLVLTDWPGQVTGPCAVTAAVAAAGWDRPEAASAAAASAAGTSTPAVLAARRALMYDMRYSLDENS